MLKLSLSRNSSTFYMWFSILIHIEEIIWLKCCHILLCLTFLCAYGAMFRLTELEIPFLNCQNFSMLRLYKVRLLTQNISWLQDIVISVIITNSPESLIAVLAVNAFINLIIIACGHKLVSVTVINDLSYSFVFTWLLESFNSGFLQSEHFQWWQTVVILIFSVSLNLACIFCGELHASLQVLLEWWLLVWQYLTDWWSAQTSRL